MKRCKYCKSLFADSMEVCWSCGANAPKYSTFGTMAGAFGKGMLYVLFFLLTQSAVSLAYSFAIGIMAAMGAYGEKPDFIEIANSKTSEAGIVSGVLAVLILIVIFAIRKKSFLKRTSLDASPGAMAIGIAVLGAALNYVFVLLMAFLPIPESILAQHENAYQSLGQGNIIVELIAVVIVAPLAEEIILRGLCFGTMRRVMPFFPAMLISSAVFGLIHGTVLAFFYATLIGMLMCYFYEISGSLWVSILLHFGFNGGSYLADMLPEEESILFFAVLFFGSCLIAVPLGAVCIRYYEKRREKKKAAKTVYFRQSYGENGTFSPSESSYFRNGNNNDSF